MDDGCRRERTRRCWHRHRQRSALIHLLDRLKTWLYVEQVWSVCTKNASPTRIFPDYVAKSCGKRLMLSIVSLWFDTTHRRTVERQAGLLGSFGIGGTKKVFIYLLNICCSFSRSDSDVTVEKQTGELWILWESSITTLY
jgi:hypothetical protein